MTDMASSMGDPDLASISNTTKQLSMCQDHNQPKEYFNATTRATYCAQCLVDQQIDRADCTESRKYCQQIM